MRKPTEKQVYFLNFFQNEGWISREQTDKGKKDASYCSVVLGKCFLKLNKGVADELKTGLRGNIADLGSLRLFHNDDDTTIGKHFSHL